MFKHIDKRFTIYFGDQVQSVAADGIAQQQNIFVLHNIAQQIGADHCAFLHQEHGIQGHKILSGDRNNYFFEQAGDYLVTDATKYGIGVVTADCVPIVIYNSVTHTAAIVHAGWRGLLAGILQAAVSHVGKKGSEQNSLGDHKKSNTYDAMNLAIYLGPGARACCYEVQQDFIDQFSAQNKNYLDFFIKKGDRTYFDSTAFIIVIARSLGIVEEKLYTMYNVCTICNLSFCSYRREQKKARRQATVICLH